MSSASPPPAPAPSTAPSIAPAGVEPVADWRLALGFAAASDAGLLSSLPGTVAEIAAGAGADQTASRVVLEALEVWGVVARDGAARYEPGPGWPSPGEAAGLLQQARFIRGTAEYLPDRLRGVVSPPAERSATELDRWQAAMGARARRVAPALIDACLAAVPHARRALDLGGGHGEYALEFARRGLGAVLQDRPSILDLPGRRQAWAEGGVEVFAGDFFESLPAGPFDVVLCSGVTHTFDGEHNRRLYQRVRPLVADGGAFMIVTFLRGTPQARVFAVQMLVVGNRGDTHGEDDYRAWLGEAGFSMEVFPVAGSPQGLIVARPVA